MDMPLITSDPAVMMGKPVVAGTRLTVELILDEMAAGTSVDQLVASHPRLTPAAVSAALAFAARALRIDVAAGGWRSPFAGGGAALNETREPSAQPACQLR